MEVAGLSYGKLGRIKDNEYHPKNQRKEESMTMVASAAAAAGGQSGSLLYIES